MASFRSCLLHACQIWNSKEFISGRLAAWQQPSLTFDGPAWVCYYFIHKMAAESLGGLLSGYKCHSSGQIRPETNDVVWVNKRYIPTDLRSNAPVPRSKFVYEQNAPSSLSAKIPQHWKQDVNQSLKTFSRHLEEEKWYPSSQATRCEEWSTLRQMFPSKGIPERQTNPRWGTGLPLSPHFQLGTEKRFPHINSPMTRYSKLFYDHILSRSTAP